VETGDIRKPPYLNEKNRENLPFTPVKDDA
jgi:hypothetical protein